MTYSCYKNCIVVVVLLLLCSALPLRALDESTQYKVDNFIYEGAQLLAQNEKARALARFKSALKLDPENANCYFWIGLSYSDLKNYGIAAKNAEAAVSLDAKFADAWLLWGQSLMYEKKYPEAVQKLAKAFRLNPDSYLAAYNIGRCYYYGFEGTKKVLARKFFRKAWELNDKFVPARYYQGLCELDEMLLPLAIVSFQWVIENDPQNIPAMYDLAVAYRKDSHVARAEDMLLKILMLDSQQYEAHLQLGHIYMIDKPSREKALYHLNRFIELAPADHGWMEKVKSLLQRDKERRSS